MVMNIGRTQPKAQPTEAALAERVAEVSWIYALPIAAAVIRPTTRGQFRLHASNPCFDELGIVGSGANAPPEIFQAVEKIVRNGGEAQNFTCRIGSGDAAAEMQAFLSVLPHSGPQSSTNSLYLLTFIDRTNEIRTEKNLRRELVSDGLTGLPNRAGFVAMLAAHGKNGQSSHHAVLLLDLSRFSRINEHIGPFAGDELIVAVARRLRGNMRGGDVLARTGGDEFAISSRMMGGGKNVLDLARRIQSCFDDPFKIGTLTISIGCAIGGAVKAFITDEAGEQQYDSADHLRLAQIALKRAKCTGQIEIYQPEASMISDNRFSMETALRKAIEKDQLSLAFQPLIEFASGRVAGFEALARWEDADGNHIPPTDFIPIAEDSGLIVPLGQWAINKAAERLAKWDEANDGEPVDCYISVNVSAIQLLRDDIVGVARDALKNHKIGGERLMIELTESAIIGDPDHALAVLAELKKLKTRIAMDDFGTGYSNLAYLQRLPIDVLKIDRSFVEQIVNDREQVAIVRTIQSLAEALHLQTTAEGVESADQARLLSAMGCDFGQGFLFARPLDAESALEIWRRSHHSPIF